jgi:hypothetical protein
MPHAGAPLWRGATSHTVTSPVRGFVSVLGTSAYLRVDTSACSVSIQIRTVAHNHWVHPVEPGIAGKSDRGLFDAFSRREAIRRLGLLGVAAAVPSLVFTGCSPDHPPGRAQIDPWWDVVTAPTADIPVLTVSDSSQLAGGRLIAPTTDYDNDPHFRYDGCHAVISDRHGLFAAPPELVAPEIITDAQDIEMVFRSGRGGEQVIGARVVVDGKLSHVQLRRFDAEDGRDYYFLHHFTTARLRHLKFEVDGVNRFKHASVGDFSVLQRPAGPHRFRHTAIGDSLQKGGANYHIGSERQGDFFYMSWESHSRYQAALMGCDSYINLGVGGTGWTDVDAGNPFSARIQTALSGSPHVLGFYGSRNDETKRDQLDAAVIATLQEAAIAPAILVSGPQQAGYSSLNDTIERSVRAAGRTWIDLDGVAGPPSSNPTGHPTFEEQLALARAAYSQTDMAQIAASVAATNSSRFADSTVQAGVLDSFDRPDGAVGMSENGKDWNTITFPGWVIQDRALANPTAQSQVFCDIDTGVGYGNYEFTLGGEYNADFRLCFFYVNSSFHMFVNSNGGSDNWRLYSRAGNASLAIATGDTAGGWTAGDVITIAATRGSTFTKANIVVRKNQEEILNASDADLGPLISEGTRLAVGVNASSRVSRLDAVTMMPEA